MGSPFASLDKPKKKGGPLQPLNRATSFTDRRTAPGKQNNDGMAGRSPSLPNMKSSASSPFANIETYKPTRDSLKIHQQYQGTSSISSSSSSSSIVSSSGTKKSSLSSVLRAQSKFSGKSSIISTKSKSRSLVSKPASKKKDELPDRLKRSIPWASPSGGDESGKPFKKRVIGNEIEQKMSRQTLQSIDSHFEGVTLSDEQQKVLDLVLNERKNVFFTGSAGTGKSFLLKLIIKKLQTRYGATNLGICAPTGLAAANIGGKTINKLFGIGLGHGTVDALLNRIKNSDTYYLWRRLVAVIIDEVSMLDSNIFEKLNELSKKVKRSDEPFGGIQVIICGDFLQLPPVTRNKAGELNYCFKSKAWKEILDKNIVLTKVFRQEGDSELIDILNALRVGKLDYKVESKLRNLSRPLKFDDGIEPTELFPTRAEVERANQVKLMSVHGKSLEFKAEDSFSPNANPSDVQTAFDSMPCSKILNLKIGAQVILLKNNVHQELVNGQLGIIEAFLTEPVHSSLSKLEKSDSSEQNAIFQKVSEIILARRGLSDSSNAEDLSFFTSFQAETIIGIMANYDERDPLLPYVNFIVPNSDKPLGVLIHKVDFSPMNGLESSTQRRQLPINLSWAISIHKSQGQTLSRVKVDLAKIFEKGQLYVAISRCVSSEGLQVLNFDRRKVFVDNEVVSFYEDIQKEQYL